MDHWMMATRQRPRRLRKRRLLGRPQQPPSAPPKGPFALLVCAALLALLPTAAAFQLFPPPPPPSSSTTSPLARRFQQQQQPPPPPPPPRARHHSLPCRLQASANDDAAAEEASFTALYQGRLPPWLLARTEALGFERPTPVQRAALGPILQVRFLDGWMDRVSGM